MKQASEIASRSFPALTLVTLVGLLVSLSAYAADQAAVVSLAVAGTALAALVVIATEAMVTAIGKAPEYALVCLMASMMLRGLAAAIGILAAVLLLDCEPRTLAAVALPLYFAMLCGEVWTALRSIQSVPAMAQGSR